MIIKIERISYEISQDLKEYISQSPNLPIIRMIQQILSLSRTQDQYDLYLHFMLSNLQLFRQVIKEHLPSEDIDSQEELVELANHLCDCKLLSPNQVQRLSHRARQGDISYPFSFRQLEQLVMTAFADPQSQQVLEQLKELRLLLRETKGVLALWKDKGLTQKERLELEATFQRGNARLREFYAQLHAQKEGLESVNEQQTQMISSLDEWVKMQRLTEPFQNYKEYQQHHQKLIDQLFAKFRVREIHFKQRKNTAKITKIQTAVGLDSRTDEPVEVTLVPKKSLDFVTLNEQLLTFNAKKELTLSSHFARYLGHNSHADSHCFLYFGEYIEGINLSSFIQNIRFQLDEETPLFKYWCYLLYRCLYDVFLMCSYLPHLPLTLSHFEVCNSGLKLILKNAQFVASREDAEPQDYEGQLLQNLGELMIGLLGMKSGQWGQQTKIRKIQSKNLISCLLHARQCHENYKQGRVKGKVSFFNIQAHPLLQSPSLMIGQTIIENFQTISSLFQASSH